MDPLVPFSFHVQTTANNNQQLEMHPNTVPSPSQSVPGRRTPLGAVGIGGFFSQGTHPVVSPHQSTDENRPGGSRTK